jgi:Mlc titration factor MtfA (ptsG expression regulator)
MKKTLIIAVAALISVSAFAQTNVVSSANVVGYVKLDTPAEALSIQGVPFLGTNEVAITELFGDTLPLDSQLLVFKNGSYQIETYREIIGPPPTFIVTTNWSPNTTVIDGSQGFWVKLPTGSSNTTNIFSGDVVDEEQTITIRPGFNLIHYPYSAGVAWTNTALSQNPTLNDRILVWDTVGQTYATISQYREIIGPPPTFIVTTNWSNVDVDLELGAGFWYESQAATTNVIVETQPYTL